MEKTNTHYRSGVKRLLAFLLCAVCVFGMIPTQAFAFSPGQKASSWLGDQYVGSDGQHYYAPAPYTYLVYNSDGTMDVRSSSGGQRLSALYADSFGTGAASRYIAWKAALPITLPTIPIHRKAAPTAIT